MKTRLAFALTLLLVGSAAAQLPGNRLARSVSGEFIAHPSRPAVTSRFYQGNQNSISLEPAVLAISCERIKQSLWHILDIKPPARGRIHLHLRPARAALEQATIVVEPGINGWDYRLDIPDSLSPSAFLRVIVHASLLEIANRGAATQTAEIPLWLAEGFSQELIATEKIEYLVSPPQSKVNGLGLNRMPAGTERREDSITYAQQVLRTQAPMTFEQLSWPNLNELGRGQLEAYRSSAHLFLRQLLQFKNGSTCLRTTLGELPQNRNWQFAFLKGFNAYFQTQLDIEKWWALQLVQFTGRDLMRAWTWEASWIKLDEIVNAPVEIRNTARDLPRRNIVTLQIIIHDWDGLSQRTAIQQKLKQLELLRPLVAQELIALVDDYRATLGRYFQKQNFSGSFFGLRKSTGPIRNRLAEETIQQLNLLDARRMALQPVSPKPVAGSTQTIATGLR